MFFTDILGFFVFFLSCCFFVVVVVVVFFACFNTFILQVCVSFPQNPDEINSLDWSMIIQSEDKDYFDKDECGFDISPAGLQLCLRKAVKSTGLWDRIFIGASENELKVTLLISIIFLK